MKSKQPLRASRVRHDGAHENELLQRVRAVLGSDSELDLFLEATQKLSKNPVRCLRWNARLDSTLQLLQSQFAESKTWQRHASLENHFLFDREAWGTANALPVQAAGLAFLQEPAAAEVAASVNAKSQDWVLDLCAAPGAKSSAIGERLTGDGAWLVALDVSWERAQRLSALLLRQGVWNSTVICADPTRIEIPAIFDRVLADVPCSGESLFAKRREHRSGVSQKESERWVPLQKALLRVALLQLQQGATRAVYSTCAYSEQENEGVLREVINDLRSLGVIQRSWVIEEHRRWPHVHDCPGGFWATVDAGDEAKNLDDAELFLNRRNLRMEQLKSWIHSAKLRVVRHGTESLDADWNDYVLAKQGLLPGAAVMLTDAQAKAYSQGQAVVWDGLERGVVRVLWRGMCMGSAKAVSGRLNNHFPKLLRES